MTDDTYDSVALPSDRKLEQATSKYSTETTPTRSPSQDELSDTPDAHNRPEDDASENPDIDSTDSDSADPVEFADDETQHALLEDEYDVSLPDFIDPETFDPDPSEFTTTDGFDAHRYSDLRGILNGEVVKACFNGRVMPDSEPENVSAMMVGSVEGVTFGLILGFEPKAVMALHVLSIDSVAEARMSGLWDESAISKMKSIVSRYQPDQDYDRDWNVYDWYENEVNHRDRKWLDKKYTTRQRRDI